MSDVLRPTRDDLRPLVGRCIGCMHDFRLGPCGGCGAIDAEPLAAYTARRIAALSEWVDADPANAARDREAAAWGRVAKVSEECGEAVAAMIGATGQNPRKGVHGCMADVIDELLDVALTALCAVEHFSGNDGSALAEFAEHVAHIHQRAGLPPVLASSPAGVPAKPCVGNDPACLCQDGDACHYVDDSVTGTKGWTGRAGIRADVYATVSETP